MATIKPISDNVLVKRVEAEDRTKGGILLPETAKEKPREGRVIAVGDGRLSPKGTRVPMQVKPEDRVLFSSYAGNEITVDGEDFLIMHEEDILAIVG